MSNENIANLPHDVQDAIKAEKEKAEKGKAAQDYSSLPEQARAAMAREGMLDAAGKAAAKTAAEKEKTYTVKAGDSLSKIAKQVLGDATRWPEIFELNKDQIENPDLIHPGQVFRLP